MALLSDRWEICLPCELLGKASASYLERTLELGYSALILGGQRRPDAASCPQPVDLKPLLEQAGRYGLAIILAPSRSDGSACAGWQEGFADIQPLLGMCGGILYEGQRYATPDGTQAECLREELRLIEAVTIPQRLFFYLPAVGKATARHLQALATYAGEKTHLLFPSVAGQPHCEERPLHPFWETLREDRAPSATPLLPVVNAGCIGLGEGLWPLLSTEALERVWNRMSRTPVDGTVCLTSALPKGPSPLEGSLWTAAQMLLGDTPPQLLADIWCRARFPAWPAEKASACFASARELALSVRRLLYLHDSGESPELVRAELDLAWSRLARMRAAFGGERQGDPSLVDYLRPFLADMQRLLLRACKRHHIPQSRASDDLAVQKSFWTSETDAEGTLLRTLPNVYHDDETLCRLYEEGRWSLT